jgi:hypothetical protein
MHKRRHTAFFFAAACLACTLTMPAKSQDRPVVQPSAHAMSEFFKKYVDCGGIPVRSSSAVADEALRQACEKISLMLKHIPEVRDALVRRGVELHIIGRDEQTSDLPEFQEQRGKRYVDNRGRLTTIDARTRGMGGRLCSCGEENILRLPGDRYGGGSDICIHEFAHAVMNYGIDAEQRQLIDDQYARAMAAGLWRNAYAATNAREYWAVLSMWYFGSHGARRRVSETPTGDGPEALRAYDPQGFALLQAIYGDAPRR